MWKNTYATILQLHPRLLPYHTYCTLPHPVIPPLTYSLHPTLILIMTTPCHPKTLYWKTVREKADDDILTKQYFPRAHTIERREYETGLIIVGANSSQRSGGKRDQQMTGPWMAFLREPPNKAKRSLQPHRFVPVHSLLR
jgi:hypothetical protein